jgi:hypothetical protein
VKPGTSSHDVEEHSMRSRGCTRSRYAGMISSTWYRSLKDSTLDTLRESGRDKGKGSYGEHRLV